MNERSTRPDLEIDRDSVVVLCKRGVYPSHFDFSEEERAEHTRHHVDLMLSVCREHRLQGMEGYRLTPTREPWQRFWIIEFPSFEGAEAWIEAEVEPPSGPYNFSEYHLGRRWGSGVFSRWATRERPVIEPLQIQDMSILPHLKKYDGSVVVFGFAQRPTGHDWLGTDFDGYVESMKAVAEEHGLMGLEVFKVIDLQDSLHSVWIAEFETLEGAEAWSKAEEGSPQGGFGFKVMHLARRWAPEYFSTWVPSRQGR